MKTNDITTMTRAELVEYVERLKRAEALIKEVRMELAALCRMETNADDYVEGRRETARDIMAILDGDENQ